MSLRGEEGGGGGGVIPCRVAKDRKDAGTNEEQKPVSS